MTTGGDTGGPANSSLPADTVGLLEGLTTTRAIRRYRPEPVPPEALRAILFAATRAPSGSNRQPFRFLVLTDGERAGQAKALIAGAARRIWEGKRQADGYDGGSGAEEGSPKQRMARTMEAYVEGLDRVPVLILACLVRYRAPVPTEGASVYPACQNILLAARALGYGGVLTGFQAFVEDELRELLGIPDGVFLAATITLGRPEGGHGPVRRRPMPELVYGDAWGAAPSWAVDPPATRHTSAGPPRPAGDGVRIRRAGTGDVAAAAGVLLRSRHAAVPAIPRLAHTDDDVRRWLAEQVFGRDEIWVAEDVGGTVIGMMVLSGNWVEQLYIDPGHSGQGVGGELLATAKRQSPDGLQLWAFQTNTRAHRFYERHGFVAVERTDGARNEEGAPDVRYAWGPGV